MIKCVVLIAPSWLRKSMIIWGTLTFTLATGVANGQANPNPTSTFQVASNSAHTTLSTNPISLSVTNGADSTTLSAQTLVRKAWQSVGKFIDLNGGEFDVQRAQFLTQMVAMVVFDGTTNRLVLKETLGPTNSVERRLQPLLVPDLPNPPGLRLLSGTNAAGGPGHAWIIEPAPVPLEAKRQKE